MLIRYPFFPELFHDSALRRDFTMPTAPVLYFSLELGSKNWKLAFTVGLGEKPRLRTTAAWDTDALLAEVYAAKNRFDLRENTGDRLLLRAQIKDDFSFANYISICCAAHSSTAHPCDWSLDNFIKLGLGAVLRASVRRHRCAQRARLQKAGLLIDPSRRPGQLTPGAPASSPGTYSSSCRPRSSRRLRATASHQIGS
jgi:hypothetical protein